MGSFENALQLTEETEVGHVAEVTCADPKTDIVIGDHTVLDLSKSYNGTKNGPEKTV